MQAFAKQVCVDQGDMCAISGTLSMIHIGKACAYLKQALDTRYGIWCHNSQLHTDGNLEEGASRGWYGQQAVTNLPCCWQRLQLPGHVYSCPSNTAHATLHHEA